MPHQADSTPDDLCGDECRLRGLVVHVPKRLRKCHLSVRGEDVKSSQVILSDSTPQD